MFVKINLYELYELLYDSCRNFTLMLYSVLKNNNITVHYFDIDVFDPEVFKNIDVFQVPISICNAKKTMKFYGNYSAVTSWIVGTR